MIVDIETLGTKPGCAITQVAATSPNRESPIQFNITLASCAAAGLTADTDTLAWRQGKGLPIEGDRPVHLAVAMACLRDYYPGNDERIWTRGPDFDLGILRHAAQAVGVPLDWPFWLTRDIRTAADLVGNPTEDKPHRALGDVLIDEPVVRQFEAMCEHVDGYRGIGIDRAFSLSAHLLDALREAHAALIYHPEGDTRPEESTQYVSDLLESLKDVRSELLTEWPPKAAQ